jgi:DNA mismatch repair ATPase MutS
MSFIDYTSTPYGRRLLRKWLAMPLTDSLEINSRLDSIEDL